ncbi:MAG: DUF971 domain-containing protein [Gammaproteobacteria bacterium]|nr:DUF971 domain-containing protein [Gammaproteobacteria bacterium]
MSDTPKPTDIILHQQSHTLEIAFDDGARYNLPCELLRVYSPSAEVRGHWGQHAKLEVDKQDVNITQLKPVGAYAVKIFFDDGHDSGLYDWRYLYELGRKRDLFWNEYLQKLAEAGHQRKPPRRESSGD